MQAKIAIVSGAAVLLLGSVLTAHMIVVQSWPTTLFPWMMGVGLAVLTSGVWALKWNRPSGWPIAFLRKNIAVVALVVIGGWLLVIANFSGVEKRLSFPMIWSYGESSREWPGSRHLILAFKEFPNHYIHIYSQDLDEYLESLSGSEVQVSFDAVYDFGELRGFRIRQIGKLTRWRVDHSYTGVKTNGDLPSPWEGK